MGLVRAGSSTDDFPGYARSLMNLKNLQQMSAVRVRDMNTVNTHRGVDYSNLVRNTNFWCDVIEAFFADDVTRGFAFVDVVSAVRGAVSANGSISLSEVLDAAKKLGTYLEPFANEKHISRFGYGEFRRLEKAILTEATKLQKYKEASGNFAERDHTIQ